MRTLLSSIGSAYARMVQPSPKRCRLGWHAWDLKGHPSHLGHIRTCLQCGLRQILVPDMGGVSAGLWEPLPLPSCSNQNPPEAGVTDEQHVMRR